MIKGPSCNIKTECWTGFMMQSIKKSKLSRNSDVVLKIYPFKWKSTPIQMDTYSRQEKLPSLRTFRVTNAWYREEIQMP